MTTKKYEEAINHIRNIVQLRKRLLLEPEKLTSKERDNICFYLDAGILALNAMVLSDDDKQKE